MLAYMNAESLQKDHRNRESPLLQQEQAEALAEGRDLRPFSTCEIHQYGL